MGARIVVNGEERAVITDQFLRLVLPLENLSESDETTLRVELVFDNDLDEKGRFMACSGGWDWAPFTRRNKGEAHVMSKGIWKSVYLVSSPHETMLTHIVPQIVPVEPYVTPLCDERGATNPPCRADWAFHVEVRVHLLTAITSPNATLTLHADWAPGEDPLVSMRVSANSTISSLLVPAPVTANAGVRLWWPNGLGEQHLHKITICLHHGVHRGEGAISSVCAARKVGFRAIALVTGDDTDTSYVREARHAEGNSNHGMYFRINGHMILARGSNVIPMDNQEGRYRGDAHARLVESAAHAHFNMVRVWGGGVFMPRAFYEACDRFGVMVFHDMMYAQRGHSPARERTQADEIRHQVRRLSHHPSIVVWNSCNECVVIPGTPTAIYADFVIREIVNEDISRIVWPSCPSNGWTRGVHRLTSLPIARNATFVPHVNVTRTIEAHGPYRHGTGFPATNGITEMQTFVPDMPTTFVDDSDDGQARSVRTGPSLPSLFASEFGTVVMSSYESLAPTLDPRHQGLHGGAAADSCTSEIYENQCEGNNSMAERNYPCDSLIESFFGANLNLEATGEAVFRAQLFLCMLAQALDVRSAIERFRASNTFGILTWQLNEIWPTGGWGSLEYGSQQPGQVVGGRWKLLHHWFAESLYKDVFIACGRDARCVVRVDSDRPDDTCEDGCGQNSMWTLEVVDVDIATGQQSVRVCQQSFPLQPFVAKVFNFGPELPHAFSKATTLRIASLSNSKGKIVSQSETLMALPKDMLNQTFSRASCHTQIVPRVLPGTTKNGAFRVHLGVSTPAAASREEDDALRTTVLLYVQLTTLAQGRFMQNGFAFLPGAGLARCLVKSANEPCEPIVEFRPFAPDQGDVLNRTVRAEHMMGAACLLQTSRQPIVALV
ncbi:Beta-mannosidase [Hondaea fermentalgiana]|uniref:Beta-mannosidase n=1 Tax=Hondaea fermentalgiana TaxID=2315210 RepID=A0A2R5GIB9_9STRA|nr:Beta-mannosidase [Hondaea fermentalgiana]|eukprot:GBG30059.1 Beta-mannosidase [Hondaea fermentalgiana]